MAFVSLYVRFDEWTVARTDQSALAISSLVLRGRCNGTELDAEDVCPQVQSWLPTSTIVVFPRLNDAIFSHKMDAHCPPSVRMYGYTYIYYMGL